MKVIDFKDCNIIFAENKDKQIKHPELKIKGGGGHVVARWQLSVRERVKIFFTGVVWMDLLSFSEPLIPRELSSTKKEMHTTFKTEK